MVSEHYTGIGASDIRENTSTASNLGYSNGRRPKPPKSTYVM